PPPVGELATWLVPIKFHVPAEAFAAGVIAAGATTASAATAAAMDLLTFSPPSIGKNRLRSAPFHITDRCLCVWCLDVTTAADVKCQGARLLMWSPSPWLLQPRFSERG